MPVRFQVDGDFYDHPKSIGLSDAAVALWTRAGSYSAAKLTDGFIVEHVLVLLSRTPTEAAEELVTRGLWKRTKGGYRFHQWEERGNLTKERVEDDRRSDRQRKRRQRQLARQNANAQVNDHNVQPDSGPDSLLDSEGIPGGFRGLSVSESESTNPPTPQGGKNGSRRSSNFDYDADKDFLTFWEIYPRKTAKPKAYEAWKAARKRGAAVDVVTAAAERYRNNPDRKPDYTAHPATWLNGERYNDDHAEVRQVATGAWWEN